MALIDNSRVSTIDNRAMSDARQLVESLVSRGRFGHPVEACRLLETHISWVVLTGQYAYKIKKPVELGFLNFSSLDLRHRYCQLELTLNRRFAPELYLDVVAIGGDPDTPVIGGHPVIEWAVRMRQFADRDRVDHQIALGEVTGEEMKRFGERLAGLHREAGRFDGNQHYGSFESIAIPIRENFEALKSCPLDASDQGNLDRLETWCEEALVSLEPVFQARKEAGFVRECHGDLHLQNLVKLKGQITPFDCIEFDPGLRCIDVINEVAFLFMDTVRVGRIDLGYAFLNRYLEITGDYGGIELLTFYTAYRCMVRAKIEMLRQAEIGDATASILQYLELANTQIDTGSPPRLSICRGFSGSGKTYYSELLVSALPAIRVRSDIVRKQIHGIDERGSSDSELASGLYSRDASIATYKVLSEYSETILNAGYNVIVDAAFLGSKQRNRFREIADRHNARFIILDYRTDKSVLVERIQRRLRQGTDASEANLSVLEWQIEQCQPLSPEEKRVTVSIDTGNVTRVEEVVGQILEVSEKRQT